MTTTTVKGGQPSVVKRRVQNILMCKWEIQLRCQLNRTQIKRSIQSLKYLRIFRKLLFDPKYFLTELSKIMHRVVTLLADVINRQTAWMEKLEKLVRIIQQELADLLDQISTPQRRWEDDRKPKKERLDENTFDVREREILEILDRKAFSVGRDDRQNDPYCLSKVMKPFLMKGLDEESTEHIKNVEFRKAVQSAEINVTLDFQESPKESPDTHPRESTPYQVKTNRNDFNKGEREISEKEKTNREAQKHRMTPVQGDRQIIVEPRKVRVPSSTTIQNIPGKTTTSGCKPDTLCRSKPDVKLKSEFRWAHPSNIGAKILMQPVSNEGEPVIESMESMTLHESTSDLNISTSHDSKIDVYIPIIDVMKKNDLKMNNTDVYMSMNDFVNKENCYSNVGGRLSGGRGKNHGGNV